MFKKAIAKVQNNLVGTASGAVVTYWAVGKYANVSKMWLRLTLTALGGVAGAYAQSAVAAKKSAPKAGSINK